MLFPQTKQAIEVKETDVVVEVIELDRTEYCMGSKRPPLDETRFTDKMKYRIMLMHRVIRENCLLDDPTKLYNLILRDEKRRGFKDIMCRKTFYRLLTRMCMKKRIRLWQVRFQYENKFRTMMYISDRKIDTNYSLMQSGINQAKARFILNIHNEKTRRLNAAQRSETTASPEKDIAPIIGPPLKHSNRKVVNYGSTPKFVRIRTLHEFLFYLVYEYDTTSLEVIPQEEAVELWKRNESYVIDYDDLPELSPIYSTSIEWKMFVSPLIKHQGLNKGWCLMSDCIYRMPLSILVKLCNISHEIVGLDEYLCHPIKRHFLIHTLPLNFQHALFARRKYIYSIDDLMKRMCCMGLAQCRPDKTYIKDHSYYYLNRRATLLDTTTSAPGYIYISKQDYTVQQYEFTSSDDISQYWDDMFKICTNTRLNRRSAPHRAQMTNLKMLWQNKRLAQCIQPIEVDKAEENDVGTMPGDNLGAAGLDSTFFAHLFRNWSFNQSLKTKAHVKPTPIRYNRSMRVRVRDTGTQKRNRLMVKPLHKLVSTIRKRKRIANNGTGAKMTTTTQRKKKTVYYDEVDEMALRRMSRLRVDWNSKEDNFLLLCRVAYLYLCPNGRPNMPFTVVRDLIHWSCGSLNKTAMACKRRIAYIMKNSTKQKEIVSSIHACLGEIKENKMINKRFGRDFIKNLRKLYPNEGTFLKAYNIHFVELVYILSSQYYNLTNASDTLVIELPDTLTEFNENFYEKPEIYNFNPIRYDEPTSTEDIEVMTIITLIHSTMCCSRDKTSWSIQLYEVYKDFQEHLLSLAMQKVRADQLISMDKAVNQSHLDKDQNRCLPLSASSYHLSITYQSQMLTKIMYDLFDDAFEKLKDIAENCRGQQQEYPYNLLNSSTCFFLTELLHRGFIDVSIEIPKQILVLDPTKDLYNDPSSICSRFKELFNYISKVDLIDIEKHYAGSKSQRPQLSTAAEMLPTTSKDAEESNVLAEKLKKIIEQSDIHYFCIVNNYGRKQQLSGLKLNENGYCPFDCLRRDIDSAADQVMKCLTVHRKIWSKLSADEQHIIEQQAHEAIDINDTSRILSVYYHMLTKPEQRDEALVNVYKENFAQFLERVETILIEEEKEDNDDNGMGGTDDLKAEFKKRYLTGEHINEKIHKFHDFLYVNTCKLTIISKTAEQDEENCSSLIQKYQEKRETILNQINL